MSDTQLATREERAPVAIGDYGVQFRSMDELARFCQAVHNSGLAPSSFKTPQAIMVAVQMGAELGLPPMAALNSIAVINGRPSVWGDGALSLVKSHPDFVDIIEATEGETATCTIKRKNQTPVTRTFSMTDAKRAGLVGKQGPWTQYPQRMLQMRARSWAMRDAFPDALRGVGIREEQMDVEPKPARVVKEATITFADDKPETPQLQATSEEGTLL